MIMKITEAYIMHTINGIQNIVWIESDKRCCSSTNPGNIYCVLSSWIIIENFKLVTMRMSVELCADYHVESIDDATKFS